MLTYMYIHIHVHWYWKKKICFAIDSFSFSKLMVPKPKAQMPQGFIAEGKMCLMCLQRNLLITGLQLREQHT